MSSNNNNSNSATDRVRRGLIGANAVLLLALALVTFAPVAEAQQRNNPNNRTPGRYTIVSGRVQGAPSSGMYVLDTVNRELVALIWNSGQKQFQGVGFRSLDADGAGGGQPR